MPRFERQFEAGEDSVFSDTLGLRETLDMLADKADIQASLDILETALMEPVPDLDNPEAVTEYVERMQLIEQSAKELLADSEVIKKIEAEARENSEALRRLTS